MVRTAKNGLTPLQRCSGRIKGFLHSCTSSTWSLWCFSESIAVALFVIEAFIETGPPKTLKLPVFSLPNRLEISCSLMFASTIFARKHYAFSASFSERHKMTQIVLPTSLKPCFLIRGVSLSFPFLPPFRASVVRPFRGIIVLALEASSSSIPKRFSRVQWYSREKERQMVFQISLCAAFQLNERS